MAPQLRFIVLQPGARLHYAVPALLAREGMLERLFTDIHAPSTGAFGELARAAAPRLPTPLARLAGRQLPPELRGKVTSAPVHSLINAAARAFGVLAAPMDPESYLRSRLGREGFGRATAFYTLSNADLELVRTAKTQGLFIVHEQIINPHVGRLLRDERERFPGIERQEPADDIERGILRDEQQWRLADLVVCASDFVKNEILEHGIRPERVAVVPYGIKEDWLDTVSQPNPGRILFVGSVGLRKGNQYLAAASRELSRRGVTHHVRVVGPFEKDVLRHPELAGPTYVGQVPRVAVREEFRRADVFVLPTLAESFALVHLEALACGVPVITTPNCGSTVRDGIDGFVVPPRDPAALANRIEQVITDRALRERLASNARARAREFTWSRYRERLLDAFFTAERARG